MRRTNDASRYATPPTTCGGTAPIRVVIIIKVQNQLLTFLLYWGWWYWWWCGWWWWWWWWWQRVWYVDSGHVPLANFPKFAKSSEVCNSNGLNILKLTNFTPKFGDTFCPWCTHRLCISKCATHMICCNLHGSDKINSGVSCCDSSTVSRAY